MTRTRDRFIRPANMDVDLQPDRSDVRSLQIAGVDGGTVSA